jgi:hypothetical protein
VAGNTATSHRTAIEARRRKTCGKIAAHRHRFAGPKPKKAVKKTAKKGAKKSAVKKSKATAKPKAKKATKKASKKASKKTKKAKTKKGKGQVESSTKY